jgi:hypothetical protein
MSGDTHEAEDDGESDIFKLKDEVKYYSLLVGPAYRVNEYVSAAELLLNFQHQALVTILNLKSIVHARYGILREFDVNYGADYLDNFSSSHLESSTN